MNQVELMQEIHVLRKLLKEKEESLAKLKQAQEILQKNGLSNSEILRYSRQMLITEVGLEGQVKLKKASVLIIGAGGLGCPSSLYLVGAGVGHIGIVDYDTVEMTNLHRQLLYTVDDIGLAKVDAAAYRLSRLNENVRITPYQIQINSSNILDIVSQYDVILDATDNVPTRYLINDACVLAKKPLVSGAALKMDGQLTVYNYNAGPCFRCIHLQPPPPETVTNCGDGGVLGAAVGTIGNLQALEAIKIILNLPGVLSGRLLVFDGMESTFLTVRLRPKNVDCPICGINPTIHELVDYEEFCGSKANDKNPNLSLLQKTERITVEEYKEIKDSSQPHILLDVRSREEFQICHLDDATNIPYTEMIRKGGLAIVKNVIADELQRNDKANVYVLCRRGNDSQRAVKLLKECFYDSPNNIKDIIGGIHAWTRKIDSTFPIY